MKCEQEGVRIRGLSELRLMEELGEDVNKLGIKRCGVEEEDLEETQRRTVL